jgi:CHAT domain-containing protein/Flp pilus assembly protein TadD
MFFKFLFRRFKFILFCFIALSFLTLFVPAKDLSRKSIQEIESKANQLANEWDGEKIRQSITLFEKATKSRISLGDLTQASINQREIAKLCYLISDHNKGIKALESAQKLDLETKNTDGIILNHILFSRIFDHLGDNKKSSYHKNNSLKLLSKTNNPDIKAFVYLISGQIEFAGVDIPLSFEYFQLAKSLADETDNLKIKIESLIQLGMHLTMSGDKDLGEDFILYASKLSGKPENKREFAIAQVALGFINLITSEKRKALEIYQKALHLFPGDVDQVEKARIQSGMASILLDIGKTNQAEQSLQNSLELFKKANAPLGELSILSPLAYLVFSRGDKNLSEKLFNRAKKLEKNLDNTFFSGHLTKNLGLVDFENGKYDEAINKFGIFFKAVSKSGIKYPEIQNLKGLAYEKKEDFKEARKQFIQALQDSRENKDIVVEAETLFNLANLNFLEGNFKKATSLIEESIRLTESLYFEFENDNFRKTFRSKTYQRYDLYVKLLMNLHKNSPHQGFDKKAFIVFEKSRTRSMIEALSNVENNGVYNRNSKLFKQKEKIIAQINLKNNQLSELSDSSQNEKNRIKNEIETLIFNYEQIKTELKKDGPFYSRINTNRNFNIESFQNEILDENSLLLEFFIGKQESYLWMIGKNSFEVKILPSYKNLKNPINEIIQLISAFNPNNYETGEDFQDNLGKINHQYEKETSYLSELLFGQISGQLMGKRLIIVPDGNLRNIPFSSLPFPTKPNQTKVTKPFLLTNEIIIEPSASMLQLIKTPNHNFKKPEKDFLIFSDPVFSGADKRLSKMISSNNFLKENTKETFVPTSPLYGSREETKAIFRNFHSKNSTIHSDFEANRENFLKPQLAQYKIIHLATHSYYHEEKPEDSGILLSAFSRNGKKRDKFIRLQDILNSRVSADLVVLSSCETAIGKNIPGEGLMSLTNGFLQIGAKSVISSQWKVSDDATNHLMKYFYEILAEEKISTSKALRKAKIKLLKETDYKAPYYWAAFTIHGDFENKPQISSKVGKSNNLDFLLLFCSLIFLIKSFSTKKH